MYLAFPVTPSPIVLLAHTAISPSPPPPRGTPSSNDIPEPYPYTLLSIYRP
jgi:hypothetical protein